MNSSPTEHSIHRRKLAGDFASAAAENQGVSMVCLGGSAARGTADRWSDIDLIIYWDIIDEDAVREGTLPIERTDLLCHPGGTFIESYHLDGLKVDLGHVKLSAWREWIAPLYSSPEPDPELVNMAGGFLSSMVFHGEELFARLKGEYAVYPGGLSEYLLRRNMGFFVKNYLAGQCWKRGDITAWYQGVITMVQRVVNCAAAMNRYWFHAGELRWLDHHLSQMNDLPASLSPGVLSRLLNEPGLESSSCMESMAEEILGMAEKGFPSLAETVHRRRKRMGTLAVHSWDFPPA